MPISEAIGLSIVCMLVVFIALFALQMILNLFGVIFGNREQPPKVVPKEAGTVVPSQNTVASLQEDEESKTVALLTALILINEDQENKHYQITSIERIR